MQQLRLAHRDQRFATLALQASWLCRSHMARLLHKWGERARLHNALAYASGSPSPLPSPYAPAAAAAVRRLLSNWRAQAGVMEPVQSWFRPTGPEEQWGRHLPPMEVLTPLAALTLTLTLTLTRIGWIGWRHCIWLW